MGLRVRLDLLFLPSIVPRPPNQVAGAVARLSSWFWDTGLMILWMVVIEITVALMYARSTF